MFGASLRDVLFVASKKKSVHALTKLNKLKRTKANLLSGFGENHN